MGLNVHAQFIDRRTLRICAKIEIFFARQAPRVDEMN